MVVLQLEAIVCILKSNSSKRSVKCIYKTIANLETRNKLIKKADKSHQAGKQLKSTCQIVLPVLLKEARPNKKKQLQRKIGRQSSPGKFSKFISFSTYNYLFWNVQLNSRRDYHPRTTHKTQDDIKLFGFTSNSTIPINYRKATCFVCGTIGQWRKGCTDTRQNGPFRGWITNVWR